MESLRLAAFAGGDSSVVYPGFMRATPESTGPLQDPDSLVQLRYVRPKTRAEYAANGLKYVPRQVYGYQPTHILSLQPQGDAYRATVCVGMYSVYRTADDNHDKFFSTIADQNTGQPEDWGRDGVAIWRVELTGSASRGDDPAPEHPATQAGPLPAPLDDVFGQWFITGANASTWGPLRQLEYFDTPELRQQCQDAMPDDAAARQAMATGFHDSPPPHGEPIPGWPNTVS